MALPYLIQPSIYQILPEYQSIRFRGAAIKGGCRGEGIARYYALFGVNSRLAAEALFEMFYAEVSPHAASAGCNGPNPSGIRVIYISES